MTDYATADAESTVTRTDPTGRFTGGSESTSGGCG